MFDIKDEYLYFNKAKYKLPYKEYKYNGIPAFITDLNRRASLIDIKPDMISVNDTHVIIQAEKPIKIKLPNLKQKPVYLDDDTHAEIKAKAKELGMTMGKVIELQNVACRSDVKAK